MASRKLSDLRPVVGRKATNFKAACAMAGLDVLIYCTYRPPDEQRFLYGQGRTRPGRIVTWAKAGQSPHNYGLAFDCVPLIGGKPLWSTTGNARKIWEQVGEIGVACGLEWAGHWSPKKREFPHFQAPAWRDLITLASHIQG